MPTISLESLSVRVRRRREREYLPLSKLAPGDLFEILHALFVDLGRGSLNSAERTLLRVAHLQANPKERWLEGFLEVGEYGFESQLVDKDDAALRYLRRVNDVEMLPFFFLLYLPRRPRKGILVLQRFGSLGVKTALEAEFARCFKDTDHVLEIHPLIPERVVKRWTDARQVKKVRLVGFEIPTDIAQAFQLGDREEVESELVLVAKQGHTLSLPSSVKKLLGGKRPRGGFVEVQESLSTESVKVEIQVGGETRTIDVSDPGKMAAYDNVTGAVVIDGSTGHPTPDSIRTEAWKLLRIVRREVQDLKEPTTPRPAASVSRTRSQEAGSVDLDRDGASETLRKSG